MSTNIPEQLKYTKEHEWTHLDGEMATIGITDFAQSSLGDIVFVELPEVGKVVKKDEAFGVVESIKSVSDLYSPVSGEIVEINNTVADSPESLNSNAYDNWLVKIKMSNTTEANELLDSNSYKALCD